MTSTILESVEQRVLDADDQTFIEGLVSDNHQETYWKGWVVLYTKSNATAKKERILLVSNFRIFTIKVGVLKRSMRQSFAILDLEEITVSESNEHEVHMVFGGQELDIWTTNVSTLVQSVLFAYYSITYGLEQAPKVNAPDAYLDDFIPPVPDSQDGILATYMAMCDYASVPPRLPVLDYLMTSFETKERELDISACFRGVDKASASDVLTLASALRHSNWFDEVNVFDYPLRDDGLAHLSCVFGTDVVKKCVLVNTKAGKNGFAALASVLSKRRHGLTYINVSKNNIGDAAMEALIGALQRSKVTLDTLAMQACGVSAKGMKAVFDTLTSGGDGKWLSTLKVLDVSDNAAGKSGNTGMCDFLSRSTALTQLYAMNCDLVLETVLESLRGNEPLCFRTLTMLNLSGNKVTKKALPFLVNILQNSQSLTHVYLVDCKLSVAAFVAVVEAVLKNPHPGIRVWLELSGNTLTDKGAVDLANLFNTHESVATLHTLVLANNQIGADGVIALCDSLAGKQLHTLSLDNNIKLGLFGSARVKEACESVAKFMVSTSALRELSMSGDDSHYLQAALYPVLQALKQCTSLLHLDVSRNRLGDEGVSILADALMSNTTLRSFNAERNRIGIHGMHKLHSAIITNTSLVDWVVPMIDVENIVRSGGPKVLQDLKSMVFDFEMCMDRNWESTRQAGGGGGGSGGGGGGGGGGGDRDDGKQRRKHNRQASDMFELMSQGQFRQQADDENDVSIVDASPSPPTTGSH